MRSKVTHICALRVLTDNMRILIPHTHMGNLRACAYLHIYMRIFMDIIEAVSVGC